MSSNSNQVNRAVRRALCMSAVAAAASLPAMAADETAPAAAPIQEVVVTGSRIQSPNVTAISPVTTVSAADITATGLTRTEDILNNLPMVFAGQNNTVSNGADGTSTVNLRGLGPQRTLVLVNGRRLGPGSGSGTNISDINQVPAALIERVDILTGGASSVYGADAVAGVVNFVLNTRFQGVRIDAGYDFYQHTQHNAAGEVVAAAGDALPDHSVNTGFGKNVAVLIGSNFADDKGNATFYATYDQKAPSLEAKFDYSACVLDSTKAGNLKCGGSGTSARNGAGGYFQAYGLAPGPALFTNTVDGGTGAFRPFDTSDLYNFGPLNYFQTPNTRWTAGTFLNYDVNPHVNAYSEIMFERNETSAQIAASGDFFNNSFIPCNDPLLTAEERGTICSPANLAAQTPAGGPTPSGLVLDIGRRNVEGGGRVATFRSDSFRLVVGARGDINDAWTYDAYAQRNTVDFSNTNENYFSNANIIKSLNVIPNPSGAGQVGGLPAGAPVCASQVDGTDPTCVPWNIWVPNGVTKAATDYLAIPLLVEATTTEQVVSGSVTGDLGKYGVKLPSADDGIRVNVGAEWRGEFVDFKPDLASFQGNAAGSGGPTEPVNGAFTVREVFTEASVPLVNHAPLAESLSADLGYRYSSYSEGFKTNTYKLGLQWQPIEDIRVRASYQRAVRAPNLFELFQNQAVGLDGSTDPCANAPGSQPKATAAQCALAGLKPGQYGNVGANPAAQYNGFIGGNPNLKPETSDTYSAGIILQPQAVPGLVVSVDYFNIKVKDTIGPITEDTILANCVATGDPQFCSAIHRDPNGSLFRTNAGFVNDLNVNFGSLLTKGIDLKGDYRLQLPAFGSVAFAVQGTKLIGLNIQPLTGGPSYNCEGLFGVTCGAPNVGWRHVVNTTWSTPWDGLDVTLRWRYIGSADSQLTSSDPQLNGNPFPLTSHIPAYNYLDLSAMFNVYKGVRLQLGVNNIADKDPPIIVSGGGGFGSDCPTITTNQSSCNGNTFPGTYDSLGRFIFAHASVQF
ncbi:MAG: TonB-dependent receptor domain-containing protein [Steroidobacteraceae bacterium]